MNDTVYGVALIPVIVAIVEAAKKAEFPADAAPLLAMILGGIGMGVAALVNPTGFTPLSVFLGVLNGVVVGLAATGSYSGIKNATEKKVGKDKG